MSIAFVASTGGQTQTSATAAMTIPTGASEGNVLVAAVGVCNQNTTDPVITFPSGWTVVDTAHNSVLLGILHNVCRYTLSIAVKTYHAGDGTQNATADSITGGGLSWSMMCLSGLKDGDSIADAFAQHSMSAFRLSTSSAALTTNTVTDSTVGLWRIEVFGAGNRGTTASWGSYSPADTERQDNSSPTANSSTVAVADSNGTVDASGGTSVSATPTASDIAVSWIGLLKPGNATSADIGTGTDAAQAIIIQASDSASGVDSAQLVLPVGETGVATDSATSPAVTGADTAVAVDTATVRVFVPDSDTGSGVDSGFSTRIITVSDSGSAVDAAGPILIQAPDSASGVDAASVAATIPVADSFAGSDGATVVLPVSDSATGAEAATLRLPVSDSSSASDAATLLLPVSDAGSSSSAASVSATISASDSAVGSEYGVLIAAAKNPKRTISVQPEDRTIQILREVFAR